MVRRPIYFVAAVALAILVRPVSAEQPATPGGPLAATYLKLLKERLRHIDELHAYQQAGDFPKNEDFPGQRVPYFVDAHGTHCAVGYLMQQDRQTDLIGQIVKGNNHIRVMEIKDGPALEWILHSGLTQEECARIQPSYEFKRPRPLLPSPKPEPTPDPQIVQEQQRIRDHLKKVEEELRANTFPSLEKAVAMLMPSIEEAGKAPSAGFTVIPAPTGKEDKSTLKIVNNGEVPVSVRLTFFDAKGNAVGPRLPNDSVLQGGKGSLKAGAEVEIAYDCRDTWVFVEWSSKAATAPNSVRVTSPFVTVAREEREDLPLRKSPIGSGDSKRISD